MDFLTLRESQRKVNPGFSYILNGENSILKKKLDVKKKYPLYQTGILNSLKDLFLIS